MRKITQGLVAAAAAALLTVGGSGVAQAATADSAGFQLVYSVGASVDATNTFAVRNMTDHIIYFKIVTDEGETAGAIHCLPAGVGTWFDFPRDVGEVAYLVDMQGNVISSAVAGKYDSLGQSRYVDVTTGKVVNGKTYSANG